MPLHPGTLLGQFEILNAIGAGGMGEVYRARDSQLDRDVAVKVLPPTVTWDEDRRRRFEDEARAVAALSHPNILAVYQMGSYEGAPYLVSELLEGETLRELIKHGRLAVRKAIDYGVQIARGIAAAHEKGVIHRDLKPENLFVTRDGHVKILDFGLAKMTHLQRARAQDGSTVTLATEPGVVMGTVGYMSPEQVRAQEITHRTDIFSFGAVLHEMLTGQRAFEKPTTAETMSAILNEEPPEISQLNSGVPPGLQRIVNRCLEKKAAQRFQSASDLAFALDALSSASESAGAPVVVTVKASRLQRQLAAAGVVAAALTGIWFWWQNPPAVPQITGVMQLTKDAVSKWGLVSDGTRLYFSEGEDYKFQLMEVSALGGETAPIAAGIDNPMVLAISPDSAGLLLGTYGLMNTSPLWLLPLPAGAPRRLGGLETNFSACFFPDGRHFAYADEQSIKMADSDGLNCKTLVEVAGRAFHPVVSPDNRRVRFNVADISTGSVTLWELDVPTGKQHQLLKGSGRSAVHGNWTLDSRYFVFKSADVVRGDLWALPEKTRILSRQEPEPIRLTNGPLSYSDPVISRNGQEIFAIGRIRRGELVQYDEITRQFVPFLSGISAYEIRFSRDGKWAVYISYPDYTLWRSRADGSDRLQLSYPPFSVSSFAVSPEASKVAFSAAKPGRGQDLYIVSMQGGEPRLLVENGLVPAWSPDGATLVFSPTNARLENEIRKLNLHDGKVTLLPNTQGKEPVRWPTPDKLLAVKLPNTIMTFDPNTQNWSDLAVGPCATYGVSPDERYLYCEGTEVPYHKMVRVRIADGHRETLMEIKNLHRVQGQYGTLMSVAPDGSVLLTRDIGTEEVYALSVKWP